MSNDAGTSTAYAEDLIPGARNAMRTCLRVRPGEDVAIVTDRETEEIAASLADQVREADGAAEVHVMEDYGPRPMLALPGRRRRRPRAGRRLDLRRAAQAGRARVPPRADRDHRPPPDPPRAHGLDLPPDHDRGHARDFDEVDAISTARARPGRSRRRRSVATSPGGSRLEATFDPAIKWLKTSGIISTEKWANLPGGEVLTAPARVDGVYVADGVLGDYLCARYGDLRRTR